MFGRNIAKIKRYKNKQTNICKLGTKHSRLNNTIHYS